MRIVHLGLGAFHRSHQAWWTGAVDAAGEWGIAAFTVRSPASALALANQDGLFTLIERGPQADAASVVSSIVAAHDGADLATLCDLVAAPTTSIVTLTITEAGHHFAPDGALDERRAEVVEARQSLESGGDPRTALARLVVALDARLRHGGAPLAVVPCDNLPANGTLVRAAVLSLARHRGEALQRWIAEHVSFVSTGVDRITPRTTEQDLAVPTALLGVRDAMPVIAEPFRAWVLAGSFPAGRPAWEVGGAEFVADVTPFERRKLWMLNGGHSLLAAFGILRGHRFVADAVRDEFCRAHLLEYWRDASHALDSTDAGEPTEPYQQVLLERLDNERLRHPLQQIAIDGSTKLRMRVVPVVHACLRSGRTPVGGASAVAGWIATLTSGLLGPDAAVPPAASTSRDLVRILDEELVQNDAFMAEVDSHLAELIRSIA